MSLFFLIFAAVKTGGLSGTSFSFVCILRKCTSLLEAYIRKVPIQVYIIR